MSYVVWEDEMNAVWSVEQQLSLLASMALSGKELTLPADGFACTLERLGRQLTEMREQAEERRRLGRKNRLGPHAQAQIIRVLSGQEGILGRDLNKLTQQLRKYAEADEDMAIVRKAWEGAWEHIGGRPETTLEEFCIGFRNSQQEHAQEVGDGC